MPDSFSSAPGAQGSPSRRAVARAQIPAAESNASWLASIITQAASSGRRFCDSSFAISPWFHARPRVSPLAQFPRATAAGTSLIQILPSTVRSSMVPTRLRSWRVLSRRMIWRIPRAITINAVRTNSADKLPDPTTSKFRNTGQFCAPETAGAPNFGLTRVAKAEFETTRGAEKATKKGQSTAKRSCRPIFERRRQVPGNCPN